MVLYGASGHAKVIIDILKAQGKEVSEIFDDNPNIDNLLGFCVNRPHAVVSDEMIISIGNNSIRRKVVEKNLCNKYGIAIHPSAIISPYATIGEGSVVMQGAVIQAGAKIGKHCIINTGATIDHDCVVSDFAHISPNSTLCGNVMVGEGTQIGVGAAIVPGLKIGKWSLICAGAVVTKNFPDNCVAAGNFCEIIRYIEK